MKNKIEKALSFPVLMSDEMVKSIDIWKKAYKDLDSLSDGDVKSMNLCSAIAAEIARLVTIEFRSSVTGSKRADFINKIYQKFLKSIRRYTEYACALGGVIFKPYFDSDSVCVECIGADRFFPTRFSPDGDIISCVFTEYKRVKDKLYLRLEHHNMTDDGIEITNRAFLVNGFFSSFSEVPLKRVKEWEMLDEFTFLEGIKKPLFSYFKIPFANNVDMYSPLGVSVYSRALDVILEADRQYSRLLWEFEGGELAIDASIDALKQNGKNYTLPKLNERLFRGVDIEVSGGDLYSVFSPPLRDDSLINGLEQLLIRIEDLCGLSRGVFSNADLSAKTATELKIMRQKTYSTISDIQFSLKTALLSLADAIDKLLSIYNLEQGGKYEVSFEFDDSIICDRETEFSERKELLSLGVIAPWELRAWYLGESDEQAQKNLDSFNEQKTSPAL
ncbi:MAG: phage portal protein [Ruminococcaceae bacterium]|nr:phage portal protein [Oscillospiraceae bacterium]